MKDGETVSCSRIRVSSCFMIFISSGSVFSSLMWFLQFLCSRRHAERFNIFCLKTGFSPLTKTNGVTGQGLADTLLQPIRAEYSA